MQLKSWPIRRSIHTTPIRRGIHTTESKFEAMRHNLRAAREFSFLATDINERSAGRAFDFYASPGNWGDALLNAGARQLFSNVGAVWRELSRSQLAQTVRDEESRRLAVIGGGGGWNRNWASTIAFTKSVIECYDEVVVLPSSFDYKMISNIDFGGTAMYTRAAGRGSGAFSFCHDMAFYIELDLGVQETLPYPLIAFRRDKERNVLAPAPDRNADLSILGDANSDYRELLAIVDRFSVIYTDRLHIGIAGAMLGRKVFLLDGNYGKNRGVYEASLAENYENVTLLEWQDFLDMRVIGMEPIGAPGYTAE